MVKTEKFNVDANRIHEVSEIVWEILKDKEYSLPELLLGLDEVISNVYIHVLKEQEKVR